MIESSASDNVLNPQGTSRFSFVAHVVVIALLMLATLFGYGRWRTGSLELVWPWLMGQQLLFSPTHIDLGNVRTNTVIERQIHVRSVSSSTWSLVGSQRSCACIGLDEFPIVVTPGESFDLTIKVGTAKIAGLFEHRLKFFSDAPNATSIHVTVRGNAE